MSPSGVETCPKLTSTELRRRYLYRLSWVAGLSVLGLMQFVMLGQLIPWKDTNSRPHQSEDTDHAVTNPSIQKLRDQGIAVPPEQWDDIPAWSRITNSLGVEPVLLGLDTCAAFRQAVSNLWERNVAPCGNFNTGTNLFSEVFHRSCRGLAGGTLVPWGKHNMAVARLENYNNNKTTYSSHQVLPVVLVRHPISWMFSTCVHSYVVSWNHTKENCPHLVQEENNNSSLIPVRVGYGYKKNNTKMFRHNSLIHMWKEWVQSYVEADFPRLVVRLEDMVYQPTKVLSQVCECVGGRFVEHKTSIPHESVKVQEERRRKASGKRGALVQGGVSETAGLLKAWKDHASIPVLWERMSIRDQRVVQQVLSEDGKSLMELLHYKQKGK